MHGVSRQNSVQKVSLVSPALFFGKFPYKISKPNYSIPSPSPRIFQVPRLGIKLKQDTIPLSYTPRKFITHPSNNYFYLIEGDHRVMGQGAVDKKLAELVCRLFLSSRLDWCLVPEFTEPARREFGPKCPQSLSWNFWSSKSVCGNLGI